MAKLSLSYHQKWYIDNKERLDKQHREWYHNNKSKRAKSIKAWQIKNKDYFDKIRKEWREENKEYHAKQKSDWKKRNKRKVVLYTEKRRTSEFMAGDLTEEKLQMVYEDNIKKYGTLTCVLCNKGIQFGEDSLEHLIPLVRGGTNDYGNLAVAHRKCNSAKGKKTLEEWKEYYGKVINR